jgi:AcrR family transcriptional regulator
MTTSLWNESLHDTASRILDAAAELFAAQGFRGTTVKEITERCGITQAALYLYFPSKDAVLAELISVGHAELTRRLDDAESHSSDGDPRFRLSALVKGLVQYGTEATVIARVADREWRALTEPHRSAAADLRRDVRRRFEVAVGACLDQGMFDLRPDPAEGVGDYQTRMLATAIIDMCLGVASWYETSLRVPTEGLVKGYQDVVLAMAGTGRPARSEKRSR